MTLSATYFRDRFRDLFEFEYTDLTTYQGRIVNRAHASTEGVELAATARLKPHLHARLTYTYLAAHDDDTGARLNRRPRHTGDAEVHDEVAPAITAGAGIHLVADNVDGTMPFGGYTTARIFASWQIHRELVLKVRVENALNRRYEEVYGYPALPVGVFGSAEWKF